jgi:CheY-like chemotaxis protein
VSSFPTRNSVYLNVLKRLAVQAREQEVRTAHDVLEAIEVAEKLQPQVILLDIGLHQT